MEKDGYYVVTDGEGLTEATIVTATSEKFYEEHPELVKAFPYRPEAGIKMKWMQTMMEQLPLTAKQLV